MRLQYLTFLLAAGSAAAHAQSAPARLPQTLARLNATAATFKSAQADFHRISYESLVDVHTPQDGRLAITGTHQSVQIGVRVTNGPALIYKNGGGKMLDKAGVCTTINGGAKAEAFLTLGFGGSGDDLQKAWEIQDSGAEKMDGQTVEHLSLKPRDPSVKAQVALAELWIDLTNGISLQQIIHVPDSRDTQTVHYTNIRLNKSIDQKEFELSKTCK